MALPTLFGIVLLCFPFLLIAQVRDKKIGFLSILAAVITLQLAIAIATQTLGIFTYQTVFTINTIIALAVFFKLNIRDFKQRLIQLKIDWILIAVIIISALSLYNVHYNYTGKYSITTTPEYQEAEHMRYPYPYFSDEWYAVALIKDSIASKGLPIHNPLIQKRPPFLNFELAFHSFFSEIFLLLRLDLLTDYTKVTIATSTLIVVLIYLFLRIHTIARLPSSIAALSALYITNGANLPGIWNLLPLTMGIITILMGFTLLSVKKKRMAMLMAFITLLFYPPVVIFYTIAILFLTLRNKLFSSIEKRQFILDYILLILLSGSLFLLVYSRTVAPDYPYLGLLFVKDILIIIALLTYTDTQTQTNRNKNILYIAMTANILFTIATYIIYWNGIHSMFADISNTLYYHSFTPAGIPQYVLWYIIPLPILVLAVMGITALFKKQLWFLASIAIGITFWIIYSTSISRLIIEYQRVIFTTSLLIVITSGFGIQWLIERLQRTVLLKKNSILTYIQIATLLLFVIMIPRYTARDNWSKLTLRNNETGRVFLPAAPANQYLTTDDLKLFQNIKQKNFLSSQWKGTVIGVATGNYPLATKPGTITRNRTLATEFQRASCDDKYAIARRNQLQYIYLPPFECEKFQYVKQSKEGLDLYKIKK